MYPETIQWRKASLVWHHSKSSDISLMPRKNNKAKFTRNLENGGNKLIFHTAKPQAHLLTKLCFYYTSASEGRRGGGTGTIQPWSYPSGVISAHLHSLLKVEYTLFHQKGHTVTWVPVQKLSIEQVFLSIWLNNVEFYLTSVLETYLWSWAI